MFSPADLLMRIRSFGANAVLSSGGLRIVNGSRLPKDALGFVTRHRVALIEHLRDLEVEADERAAIIEFDGGGPREWAEQFAGILIRLRPTGIDDLDWTDFIVACGKIVDQVPARAVH